MHYNVGGEDEATMRCYNIVLVHRGGDREV
jgi:hypothetical protein